jgi:hypothetical protein
MDKLLIFGALLHFPGNNRSLTELYEADLPDIPIFSLPVPGIRRCRGSGKKGDSSGRSRYFLPLYSLEEETSCKTVPHKAKNIGLVQVMHKVRQCFWGKAIKGHLC